MGIAYRCVPELRCTFVVWDGDVTPEQWSSHVDRLAADPAFPPGPLLLSDLSSAGTVPSITRATIDEMADRWRETSAAVGTFQCAIVPNEAWDKARQFEGELTGSNMRTMVFNEPWSACSWLGLDADVARSIIDELRGELRA